MEASSFIYFNPFAETTETRNRLPHWQQKGAVYFVTFRMADSIPASLLLQWKTERDEWKRHHPEPWSREVEMEYHTRFSNRLDQWMDAGHGRCLLRANAAHAEVAKSLLHFQDERYHVLSSVIMPNHVHLLLVLHPDWQLSVIVQGWKRYSARAINQVFQQSGTLWQRDYFDRIIRDGGHLESCIRYIRRNPVKAKLKEGAYWLYEGELARGVE